MYLWIYRNSFLLLKTKSCYPCVATAPPLARMLQTTMISKPDNIFTTSVHISRRHMYLDPRQAHRRFSNYIKLSLFRQTVRELTFARECSLHCLFRLAQPLLTLSLTYAYFMVPDVCVSHSGRVDLRSMSRCGTVSLTTGRPPAYWVTYAWCGKLWTEGCF